MRKKFKFLVLISIVMVIMVSCGSSGDTASISQSPKPQPEATGSTETPMNSSSPRPTDSSEVDIDKIVQEALDNEHDHVWVFSHFEERHPHVAIFKCECGAIRIDTTKAASYEMINVGISKEHPHYVLQECSICGIRIANSSLPTPLEWVLDGYTDEHPHYGKVKCSQCDYYEINKAITAEGMGVSKLISEKATDEHPHYLIVKCTYPGCDHSYIEKNLQAEWELETDEDNYEIGHPHFLAGTCSYEGCEYTERINQTADWEWVDGVCSICGHVKDVKYTNMYTHVEINGPISASHEGSLIIPKVIEGVDVRMVESNSFAGQVDISEIYLPETIEFVGSDAFTDCVNAVFNPTGICPVCHVPPGTPHEEGCVLAVANELDLETNKPNSIYGIWMQHIGMGAFRNCAKLESVVLGEYIRHIEDHAFEGCINLGQILILSEQAPLIQPSAFAGTHPDLKIFVPEGAIGYNTPEWEQYDVQYVLMP